MMHTSNADIGPTIWKYGDGSGMGIIDIVSNVHNELINLLANGDELLFLLRKSNVRDQTRGFTSVAANNAAVVGFVAGGTRLAPSWAFCMPWRLSWNAVRGAAASGTKFYWLILLLTIGR